MGRRIARDGPREQMPWGQALGTGPGDRPGGQAHWRGLTRPGDPGWDCSAEPILGSLGSHGGSRRSRIREQPVRPQTLPRFAAVAPHCGSNLPAHKTAERVGRTRRGRASVRTMAAQQMPSWGARTPATALERAFERKVRLGKWALLFEQLWPRAWLVLGLAGLFIALSLAGLWPKLPELPHKIVLALFGLAFAAALFALARVRWPSRDQAIRRVEAISGIKHRPASSYEDTLTLGAGDPRTAALWRVHRQRLAALLQTLRVGRPSPRTD